jgi:hypothetical protein
MLAKFKINEQDRKKSRKGNFPTKLQGEGIILTFIDRRRKRHFEIGLHHKKPLRYKEEQKIYILR